MDVQTIKEASGFSLDGLNQILAGSLNKVKVSVTSPKQICVENVGVDLAASLARTVPALPLRSQSGSHISTL